MCETLQAKLPINKSNPTDFAGLLYMAEKKRFVASGTLGVIASGVFARNAKRHESSHT